MENCDIIGFWEWMCHNSGALQQKEPGLGSSQGSTQKLPALISWYKKGIKMSNVI